MNERTNRQTVRNCICVYPYVYFHIQIHPSALLIKHHHYKAPVSARSGQRRMWIRLRAPHEEKW